MRSNLNNTLINAKLHGTHVLQIIFVICRSRVQVKSALSADIRTKAQIESAKTSLRIHSYYKNQNSSNSACKIGKIDRSGTPFDFLPGTPIWFEFMRLNIFDQYQAFSLQSLEQFISYWRSVKHTLITLLNSSFKHHD
jgi:hypothetical protein